MKKFVLIVGVALLAAACGDTLGSPSAVGSDGSTALTVGPNIVITLDADMSGPYLLIAVDRMVDEIEIEEKQGDGSWQPFGTITGARRNAEIAAHFEHWYRVRVEPSDTHVWSDWEEKEIGPANPGGTGTLPEPLPPNNPGPTPEPPFSACVCFTKVLVGNNHYQKHYTEPLAVPAGTSHVQVVTKDPYHKKGHQPEQIHEAAEIWAIFADGGTGLLGVTGDLPETKTEETFDLGWITHREIKAVQIKHAFPGSLPNSLHGVCVTFTR